MLSPVSVFQMPASVSRPSGPPAVEGASGSAARDGAPRQGAAAARRAPSGAVAGRSGVPVQIAGRTPSLSTDVLGTLGRLDGAVQTRLDPLTGEPVEIDPLTGEPMTAVAASLGSGGGGAAGGTSGVNGDVGPDGLTPEERAEVRRLQAIDRRVRQHEAAHKAAGVGVTGPATFTYVTGPDGRQYAVGGEVSITLNASGSTDPEQAIRQLEQVKRAALAPADPSPADRAAAAAAEAALAQAEAAQREQEREEEREDAAETEEGVAAGSPDRRAAFFGAAAAAYGSAGALAPGPAAPGSADAAPALTPPRTVFSLIA
ncbi:putative metalloprotease CJM1_0395 family protein [Roseospira goensis]|uniref:SprA-related family protein n=1 Tax=Roseospira goensis TaxID=391922 RepID=A0A7W6RXV0_9PROT|nr:putative metalloprotease CJM1_0395 family protein [Roseospira goensis]MBB4285071.1 hypothetical protein [Roseospira goensis]